MQWKHLDIDTALLRFGTLAHLILQFGRKSALNCLINLSHCKGDIGCS